VSAKNLIQQPQYVLLVRAIAHRMLTALAASRRAAGTVLTRSTPSPQNRLVRENSVSTAQAQRRPAVQAKVCAHATQTAWAPGQCVQSHARRSTYDRSPRLARAHNASLNRAIQCHASLGWTTVQHLENNALLRQATEPCTQGEKTSPPPRRLKHWVPLNARVGSVEQIPM
jgi:hypothetical protein